MVTPVDTGNPLHDFCENVKAFLNEHRQNLFIDTSMGILPLSEVSYGRRTKGLLSFPTIDILPEPGLEIRDEDRQSNYRKILKLGVTLRFYTYNLREDFNEVQNTQFGDRLFSVLDSEASSRHFRQIPVGKSVPYLLRIWVKEIRPAVVVLWDGVFLGGSLFLQALKEV